MKKIISILFVICLAMTAHAQQLSTGLRLGASYWMQPKEAGSTSLKAVGGQHISFDKTAFLRYKTKGKMAFELGLSHNKLKYSYLDQSFDGLYSGVTLLYTTNYTSIDASFQYDITCSHFKSCPVLKRFKTFIGVTISPAFIGQTMRIPAGVYTNGEVKEHNSDVQLWTGLNGLMSYEVSKYWSVTSSASFSVNLWEFSSPVRTYNSFQPSARASFQVGAAYKIH